MRRQSELAGIEREVNKRVEAAGEVLVSATKRKTKASNDRKAAEQRLLEVMREEKVKSYTSEDLGKTFEIDVDERVHISTWEPPKPQKPEAEA